MNSKLRPSTPFLRPVGRHIATKPRVQAARQTTASRMVAGLAGCMVLLGGCAKEMPVEFEPNMVFSHGLELRNDLPMQPALLETQKVLDELFGTPDDPKLPKFLTDDEDYATLVSLENLKLAAGSPVDGEGGLYRKLLCSECHGITGNGRGQSAALLPVYPRDYRHGIFKYKTTEGSEKPTREDLANVIRNGVPGTSMKPEPKMKEEDIQPLVDYVIYLSMRGELERTMLVEAEDLFDAEITQAIERQEAEEAARAAEDGNKGEEEEAADEEAEEPETEDERQERLEERREWIEELAMEIADSWLAAEDALQEVPDRPTDFPVPDTIEEVVAAAQSDEPSPLKESIAKGREIFGTELASCTKCHGPEGYGNGQGKYFDNWTNDWTAKMGLDPLDQEQLIPLIARGALPPRYIDPRDFREGIFRGGERPEDLFRKIAGGITGTPMPAAKLEEEQIWHLVNYVRSLRVVAPETAATAVEPSTAE